MEKIVYYVLVALASLIALTVHEYSHGYAAYKLGDPTPRALGRLTLNPIKHIDPLGALCMLFFRFGWARPVPINPRYFKKPKGDFAIVALAGPISNILLSILGALLYSLLLKLFSGLTYSSEFALSLAQNSLSFLYIFHIVNLGFALFNLIPIPPLDGSRILNVILPEKIYFKIMNYERTIYFVFLGWLLLGDTVSNFLLRIPLIAGSPVLSALAGVLSLSDLIGTVISFFSELILNLFALIFQH